MIHVLWPEAKLTLKAALHEIGTERQARPHTKQSLILLTSGFILQMPVLSIQSFEKEKLGFTKENGSHSRST